MPDLTPKQLKNLERLAKVVESGDVGVLENLLETEEKVEETLKKFEDKFDKAVEEVKASAPDMKSILEQIKGKDGVTPKKGVDYFDGEPGKDYVLTEKDKKEIAASVKVPVVEKVIEKVIERTEVVKEQPITKVEVKEVAVFDKKLFEKEIPKLGESIRDALALLQDEGRIDKKAIKGLDEELASIRSLPRGVGGMSGAFW